MFVSSPFYRIETITERRKVPVSGDFNESLERASFSLDNESMDIRPRGSDGAPGGLVLLRALPTVVVPDLHARVGYLKALLSWSPPGENYTVYQGLSLGKLQVVCVGDGFHAEARAIQRWQTAFGEFSKDFKKHKAMDEEMSESLGLMMIVMELKSAFPEYFHFLKGNHENIANENSLDNRSFMKFVYEGAMVTSWFRKFMGEETFLKYYEFEKKLPVFAVGDRFCITHSEPRKHYWKYELIESMINRKIVFDLTWTANGEADKNSVSSYLEEYFPGEIKARFFGGHRPVTALYNIRADGKYIQIHNPNCYVAAYIKDMSDFTLGNNILVLPMTTGW